MFVQNASLAHHDRLSFLFASSTSTTRSLSALFERSIAIRIRRPCAFTSPPNTRAFTTKSSSFQMNGFQVEEHPSQIQIFVDLFPQAWQTTGLKQLLQSTPQLRDSDPKTQGLIQGFFEKAMIEYLNGISDEIQFNLDLKRRRGEENLERAHAVRLDIQQMLQRYEHRRVSCGVGPCLVFGVLFFMFVDKNPTSTLISYQSLLNDSDFWNFLRLASLISGIDNDIQSFQKEDHSMNYVTLQTKLAHVNSETAIDIACKRHAELVQECKQIAHILKLRSHGDSSAEIMDQWIHFICPSIWKGFVSWQCFVKRYKSDSQSIFNDSTSILARLFPGDIYHVVKEEQHGFDGMNADLRRRLNDETMLWMQSWAGDESHLREKILASDPGLCTLLLYHYYDPKRDVEKLQIFCKFLVAVLFADDVLEHPTYHEEAKKVLLSCVEWLKT